MKFELVTYKTKGRIKLTAAEERKLNSIERENYRIYRNFWIQVMKNHGFTNVNIAKEMGITESTVRSILSK